MPRWIDAWREASLPKRVTAVAGTVAVAATFALDAFGVRPVSEWLSRRDHGRGFADVHSLVDWTLIVIVVAVATLWHIGQRRLNAKAAAWGRRMRERRRTVR
ncbi:MULTISPECIES: hypothetical protein [unclassified Streptomyces]|uniref:hypothetical protein n=1 Tax=unclassified Streptomyces TaxID=2593676 RepID=UPI00278BC137|nr:MULTISPECIES: hypothetical protein [unclassified Streptomyces]